MHVCVCWEYELGKYKKLFWSVKEKRNLMCAIFMAFKMVSGFLQYVSASKKWKYLQTEK